MPKKNLKYAIAAVTLLLLALSFFLLRKDGESVTYTRSAMGTVVKLTLMDGDRNNFDLAASSAFDEIERLEYIFSSYNPQSDLSKISSNAGAGAVEVSPEVVAVTKEAVRVARLSSGAFDPTVGALGILWGPSGEKGIVPDEEEIKKLLPLVDYKEILIEGDNKVGLSRAGMALNLGGVAKGYIAGRAVDVLMAEGVKRGIVQAGGDMVVFQEDNVSPFTIGIQHPRVKDGLIGEAYVYNGAVPTSGDYERFFEKDGIRYHHILDPRTGFPSKGTQGVTLTAKDPTTADALSTAVFVMGPEKGMELIERLDGVEGVIIDENGVARTSSGFTGKIY
ncbi:MAG: hypothetical protein A2V21_307090 [Deltaproteobacteria bacterium GWC2_55_46]|nr:MAG: hypothetical protein A2Z79_01180 [Deltaproteobacteria bacterium GWA2_55_82]OGQ62093.1 MAG: hypothetical protein A3I81_04020 [Deltaproteobacteria bacterium RIFCSPLOWO2_02_FULL_55_12]OIJ74046.1 MAG: hypothetical protein A2V21_307090 [Deltaproteobacteria bacterium GWC2_55_46]